MSLRRLVRWVGLGFGFTLLLSAVTVTAQSKPAPTASNLEAVLNQMDAAAATFKNAEADFTWDLYHKVVDETDTQKGTIYFRRSPGGTQMAADITSPDEQTILFTGGKIQIYQPKIGTINEYDASKNKSEVESFLVLGFGGRGHDLGREFQVTFAGNEDVDGVKTAKLELIPKSPKVLNMFSKIVIWVDASRDISLKQQAFEPSGDYRLSHYTNVKVNTKISDDVFKLHTSGRVKTIKGY